MEIVVARRPPEQRPTAMLIARAKVNRLLSKSKRLRFILILADILLVNLIKEALAYHAELGTAQSKLVSSGLNITSQFLKIKLHGHYHLLFYHGVRKWISNNCFSYWTHRLGDSGSLEDPICLHTSIPVQAMDARTKGGDEEET